MFLGEIINSRVLNFEIQPSWPKSFLNFSSFARSSSFTERSNDHEGVKIIIIIIIWTCWLLGCQGSQHVSHIHLKMVRPPWEMTLLTPHYWKNNWNNLLQRCYDLMMSCLWFEKLLPWNVHPCHLLGTSCARAAKRSSHTEDLHSIDKDIQMVHSPIKKSPAPFTCRGWGGRGQLCQGCSCLAQKLSGNVLQFEPGEIWVKYLKQIFVSTLPPFSLVASVRPAPQ